MISYSSEATRRFSKPPVFLTIAISKISEEINEHIKPSSSSPFLLEAKHCNPWTKQCYFVSRNTIEQQKPPLHPFAALILFLTRQERILSTYPYYYDETIQKLYRITMGMCKDQQTTSPIDDLLLICSETMKKAKQAISAMESDSKDEVKYILDQIIELSVSLRRKYTSLPNSHEPSPESSSEQQSHDNTTTSTDNSAQPSTANIPYIERKMNELDNPPRVPWRIIYEEGRKEGYFAHVGKDSLKAAWA
ncbi:hypothetical protein INT45_009837 [Circinella minor]|uniref:Uncharacterized protein n=1 Tax=Circinella minor TaxID=1195481 RepID=A0A8H7S430_9FUNG|nr:hypothetical protein INT45_009837 [Circinella minor]